MDIEQPIHIEKVCRVCLKEGEMKSIFEENISTKIMVCASVQVWPNDGLPEKICLKCSADLHITFDFKEQCEKSDIKLRKKLTINESSGNEQIETLLPYDPPREIYQEDKCVQFNKQNLTSVNFSFLQEKDQCQEQLHNESYQIEVINSDLPIVEVKRETSFLGLDECSQNNLIKIEENGELHSEFLIKDDVENSAIDEVNINGGKQKIYGELEEIEVFKCDQCNRSFIQSDLLEKHLKTHTVNKRFKCDICGKSFRKRGGLNMHDRTHTGFKPFKCNKCDMSFTSKINLLYHDRKHTGYKPYKCDKCEKSFSRRMDLARHDMIHTNLKPFECEECNKRFRSKLNLAMHVKVHTGCRPYQCEKCGKNFTTKGQLTDHDRRHAGYRPYKCDKCEKCFTKKSELVRHDMTHTGLKPYKCDHCEKTYSRQEYLNKHYKLHTV